MTRKLTITTLVFLLAAVFLLAMTGCPPKEPDEGPMRTPPAGTGETDAPAEVETPPSETTTAPPEAVELGPLQDVVISFYMAMSELDFDTAKMYCTDEYWTEIIEPLIASVGEATEEELQAIAAKYEVNEDMRMMLLNSEEAIDGETGTLTLPGAEEGPSTLLFTMVDGAWLMSGVM